MLTTARSLAILAGGQATRFGGRDKSALVVGGATILERQLAELGPLTDDVMIVARPDVRVTASRNARIREINDIVPGSGPLGGIHAALTEARSDAVLVIACDMPYVTAAFADYLLSVAGTASIVVPRSEGRDHPLCAVYSRACVDAAARLLAERRLALRELLAAVPTRVVTTEAIARFGAPSRLLANVNTPAEYAGLEALQDHKL
jgi:molybdopterin-guanine dinucleotide biosynthesis protein A